MHQYGDFCRTTVFATEWNFIRKISMKMFVIFQWKQRRIRKRGERNEMKKEKNDKEMKIERNKRDDSSDQWNYWLIAEYHSKHPNLNFVVYIIFCQFFFSLGIF